MLSKVIIGLFSFQSRSPLLIDLKSKQAYKLVDCIKVLLTKSIPYYQPPCAHHRRRLYSWIYHSKKIKPTQKNIMSKQYIVGYTIQNNNKTNLIQVYIV